MTPSNFLMHVSWSLSPFKTLMSVLRHSGYKYLWETNQEDELGGPEASKLIMELPCAVAIFDSPRVETASPEFNQLKRISRH